MRPGIAALVLAALCWVGARAPAATTAEPLQDWEREAIALARPSEAWATVWQRQAVQGALADELLRRAALLARCPKVARHEAPFLDAAIREGIEQVAERQRALLAVHAGPELDRWRHAPVLAAWRALSADERSVLRTRMAGAAGERARSWHSALRVLEAFPDDVRVVDGRAEPARLPWLKAYLQAELLWPVVWRAVQTLDPALARHLAALQPLDRYRVEDADLLREQAGELSALMPRLVPLLLDGLPQDERGALQALSDFLDAALRPVPGAPAAAMPGPLYAEMLRKGPVQWAGDIVPRLCAPGGR